jgi:HlyD family secretion protein
MAETKGGELAQVLAARRQGRRWPVWLGLALGAAAVGGWLVWGGSGAGTPVSYRTDAVAQGALTVTVTATGTVQPVTEVDVSSELSGRLAAVNVNYNDRVTVGQEIARLDDTKLRAQVANSEASVLAAKAQVASAEASLSEAKDNLDTQTQLDRRGVTSRTSLTTIKAAFDRATAQVAIARADLSVAEANLDLNRADLEKAVIRSPINGVVLSREAEVGQIVASSLQAPVLFTLAQDLAVMQLLVDVDEADIGKVKLGNRASFTVDAYDGQSFPAEITQVRFAPETTDNVVTYKAELAVQNPDGLLRPGMTATATIVVDQVADTLTVANGALRYAPPVQVEEKSSGGGLLGLILPSRPASTRGKASGGAVWVLRNGVPVEVAVARGASDGKRTAVTADGLKAGELAILDQTTGG